MKIAVLTTDSVPMIGGVADYLHNLCDELSKSIPIFVYSTVPSILEFDTKLAYPIHRIAASRRLGRCFGDGFPLFRRVNTLLWYLKRPLEAHNLLRKVQNECDPNLVLTGRWEEISHFWCRACCVAGIPYYMFAYGMDLTEQKSSQWDRRRKQDFISASQVISISKATTDMLLTLGVDKNRILLIPPGISPEKLPSNTPDNELSKFGLSQKQYILTLCRLVKRKGVDLAIRAFAEIADEFPNLFFVIAGDGPESPDLKALSDKLGLAEQVIFMGKVNDLTKQALFQGCEFFVMPNRPLPGDMEGFGIVFLEAAMFEKAVIGGNNGGVPDAVVNGETGLLADTSDSHRPLADSMLKLLQNYELAEKMGKVGHDRAIGKFSWEKIGSRFAEFLHNKNF